MSSAAVIDPKAVALLGRGRIHPALHADERGVVIGRVTESGDYQLVTSDRAVIDPADAKGALLFMPRAYPDLAGRWPEEDLGEFLTGAQARFSEALALLLHELDRALELPRPELRAVIATWAVASYLHPLFLAFPRLVLNGERESGKSKVLGILHATAWNALLMLNPTPAVLYRLVHEFRTTLLLDEVEGLSKEDRYDVIAIINSGYKAGATVARCEGKDPRRVESFAVYAPLALAAIRNVNATTEDRCIPLVLQRGTDRQRINAEVDAAAPAFARIRGLCYRLVLTRWCAVRESYATLALPGWLNARARELWKPLLAVAAIADREDGGLGITADLLALAEEHARDRTGVSAETEALLAVLVERFGGVGGILRPGALGEPLRQRLGWREAPTPETVGNWLRRLLIPKAKPPKDRDGARYELTAERLADLAARYAVGTAEP